MNTPDHSSDDTSAAAMAADENLCPFCGDRATLHCAICDRVVCAEHVARGFSMGYAFICLDCVALLTAQEEQEDGAPTPRGE